MLSGEQINFYDGAKGPCRTVSGHISENHHQHQQNSPLKLLFGKHIIYHHQHTKSMSLKNSDWTELFRILNIRKIKYRVSCKQTWGAKV